MQEPRDITLLAAQLLKARYAVIRHPEGRLHLVVIMSDDPFGLRVMVFGPLKPLWATAIETPEEVYAAMPKSYEEIFRAPWTFVRARGFTVAMDSFVKPGDVKHAYIPDCPWRAAWARRLAAVLGLKGYEDTSAKPGMGDLFVLTSAPPPSAWS